MKDSGSDHHQSNNSNNNSHSHSHNNRKTKFGSSLTNSSDSLLICQSPAKRIRLSSPTHHHRGVKRRFSDQITHQSQPIYQSQDSKRFRSIQSHDSDLDQSSNPSIRPIRPNNLKFGSVRRHRRLVERRSSDLNLFINRSDNHLTNYDYQLNRADRLRQSGNNAFSVNQYHAAIQLYTQAMSHYPPQNLPGFPFHPGYSTSLSNRAAAHMALGDYLSASSDVRTSLETAYIPPVITPELSRLLIKRLFRLVRCHLALLDPHSAIQYLQHASDPISPVYLNRSTSSKQVDVHDHQLYQEMDLLIERSDYILNIQTALHLAQSKGNWNQALDLINQLEIKTLRWAFISMKNSDRSLPGLWSFWKAEAFARLGKPIEAYEAVCHTKHLLPLREKRLAQALIALSTGSPIEANGYLELILDVDPEDQPIYELFTRISTITLGLSRIEDYVSEDFCYDVLRDCEELSKDLSSEKIFKALNVYVHVI
ncbi:hypothetical protein BY996DRAFT_8683645, partial [Phakopsora pachyrhizi]